MSKFCTLEEAIACVPDGALLALGGNTLNRAPMAAVRELARQRKRGLRLVKTAGAMDIDLLCLAGCASEVDAGFVSYESQFSLCRHYRKAVETGQVKANEHACYTVISALRAAACGIPFMPVRGIRETDLTRSNPRLKQARDPFTGQDIAAVQAIRPDFAILHAHQADEAGNAWIDGPVYEDVLMSQAAKTVLITAEELVGEGTFRRQGRKAQVPGFLVARVAIVPRGAAPAAMYGCYPVDEEEIRAFLRLQHPAELEGYLMGRREALP